VKETFRQKKAPLIGGDEREKKVAKYGVPRSDEDEKSSICYSTPNSRNSHNESSNYELTSNGCVLAFCGLNSETTEADLQRFIKSADLKSPKKIKFSSN